MYKYIFVSVIVSVIVFSSCSDPLEGSGKYTSSVSVKSQNVCFAAVASEGMIEFSAPGAASVTTTSKWCTATLDGETVNVSATQNNTRNSRSCNVVIKCGTDSAIVNVIQKGFVFQISAGNVILKDNDKKDSVRYSYSQTLDFQITASDDWFQVVTTEDSVKVKFSENTTGHIRKGYLRYEAGDARDSIAVIQYDYSKDIAGPAFLMYKDKDGNEKQTSIVLADTYFSLPDYAQHGDWKVPFTFSASNMKLTFTNAQDVGMYDNTYYVADIMFGGGYYSTFKSISWDAYMTYSEEKGCMEAEMVDNASWSYAVEGFYLRRFSSTTYSGSTDVGAIEAFYSPKIVRYNQ